MNSINIDVWTRVKKDLAHDATGPQVFAAVLDHKQQVNAGAVRALTRELGELSLKDEPGQNVMTFGNKVHNIAMRIQ